MARALRVNLRGGWYHVMHRGIERRWIFETDRDHELFLELLGEVSERHRSLRRSDSDPTPTRPTRSRSAGIQFDHASVYLAQGADMTIMLAEDATRKESAEFPAKLTT